MSTARRCDKCRHWVQYVNGSGKPIHGECHRHPPSSQRVPVPGYQDHMFPAMFSWVTNWPRPKPDDTCGEWRKS